MSYVGNIPTTAAFPFDQFSGNGSTTAFTLSYAPAGATSIIVSISGVVQNPNTYSVSGTTLTFTPAPPTGTNNIAVLYLGLPVVATLTPGNTAYFSSSVFTATAGQTVFTPSGTYQVGFINVIRNGSQLAPADYTATNGTTVTLANPCTAGDTVVIEVFNLTSISGALPLTGGTVTGATTFNSTVSVNGANVSGFTGFKNRIINPGMVIDQRNAGAAVSVNNTLVYTLDRWICDSRGAAGNGVISFQRSSTAPTGFINSLSATLTTPRTSAAAGDVFAIYQKIEGYNVADFGFGTANAAPITVSFQVRSSIAGTYSGAISNSAQNRSYPFSFTVNAANTFETKSVTIPGDTSGTWLTDNGIGLILFINLGCGATYLGTANAWAGAAYLGVTGSTNWATGATSSTFYITGVQLERGSNATSFEFRDYGRELILCQRYYQVLANGSNLSIGLGGAYTATSVYMSVPLKVSMRSAPTLSATSGTNFYIFYRNGTNDQFNSLALEAASTEAVELNNTADISGTVGWAGMVRTNNASAVVAFSSEL